MKMIDNRKKKDRVLTFLFIAIFFTLAGVVILCNYYYISYQRAEQQKQKELEAEEAIKEPGKEIIYINDAGIPGEKEKCKGEFTAYLQEGHPEMKEVKMVCVLKNATRITDNHYLFTIQVDEKNKLFDCLYNTAKETYEFIPRSSEIFNIEKLGGAAKGENLLDKYAKEAGRDESFRIIGLSKDAEALISDIEVFQTRLEEWVAIEYPKEKIKKAKFKEIVDVSKEKPDTYCFCFELGDKEETEVYVYLGKVDGNILIAKKANVLLLQKEKAQKEGVKDSR